VNTSTLDLTERLLKKLVGISKQQGKEVSLISLSGTNRDTLNTEGTKPDSLFFHLASIAEVFFLRKFSRDVLVVVSV
jgi:hypothetical protein